MLGMGREGPGSRVGSWTPRASVPSYGSVWEGAVHKVCHAPEGGGGLRKCDSL